MNFNLFRDRISIAIVLLLVAATVMVDWNTTMAKMTHSGHNAANWNLHRSQRLETAARISKQIVAALRARGISLKANLTSLFPQLKEKIARLPADLKDCYDQSYGYIGDGPTRKVNNIDIFRDDIHSIIERVFKEITDELEKKNIPQRVKVFLENLLELAKLIIECAEKSIEKRTRWGLTPMMLYSKDEFNTQIANRYLGDSSSKVSDNIRNVDPRCKPENGKIHDLPDSFSWRKKGFVSPVRGQGQCGDCYIFAATSVLESVYMMKHNATNNATIFSPQAVLNCMNKKYGCKGGPSELVFAHFVRVGAALESQFPYKGKQEECRKIIPAVQAKSFCFHHKLSTEQIKIFLMRNGPTSVYIDAKKLRHYKGGTYHGECTDSVNHALSLVGWSNGTLLIKNSWGKNWGERGYLILPENRCGVNSNVGQLLL